jgi:hypothetical protein
MNTSLVNFKLRIKSGVTEPEIISLALQLCFVNEKA